MGYKHLRKKTLDWLAGAVAANFRKQSFACIQRQRPSTCLGENSNRIHSDDLHVITLVETANSFGSGGIPQFV